MIDTKYGPQTEQIVALIERAERLTGDERKVLEAARANDQDALREALDAAKYAALDAARHAALDAARHAALEAAWYAARHAALEAALKVTRHAALEAAWYAAWYAALEAVEALLVRDLIGQHGFTQKHYDVLTCYWRSLIGSIHPDDEKVSHD